MKEIEVIKDDSNVYGYLTALDDVEGFVYLSAFFSEHQIESLKEWLNKQAIQDFSVLRNLYVDENNRGQGMGKQLVTEFIKHSQGFPVLLIASPDEEDFNLQLWYEKLGFETIPFSCEDGPLMLKR